MPKFVGFGDSKLVNGLPLSSKWVSESGQFRLASGVISTTNNL